MIIELHDDIGEVFDEIIYSTDGFSTGINKVIRLMYEEKHVVVASVSLLEKIRDFAFIDPVNERLVDYLLNHYVDTYSSLPEVKRKLCVVPNEKYFIEDGNYYITLDKADELKQAKLSTENPKDYQFYCNIFYYFNDNKKYTISLENHSYSGGCATQNLESMDVAQNLVFAISDSDKDYFSDKYGGTALAVMKTIGEHEGPSFMDYYVLGVREKENLIPIDCYRLFQKTTNKLFFDSVYVYKDNEEFMRFVDLKGLKHDKLLCEDSNWHALYDDFIETCKNKNVFIEQKTGREKNCIKGITKDLADKMSSIFFVQSGKRSPYENRIIKDAEFDVKSHIPSYIMNEYNEVCSWLFAFGCAPFNLHNSFV